MKQDAGRQISRLANMVKRKINEFSTFENLTFAQSRVLVFLLRNNGNVIQKDIEEEYMLRPSTATALLKTMEQSGLLLRRNEACDARKKRIILTDKALLYKEKAEQGISGLEADLTRDISAGDLETFFRVTEQMIRNLDQERIRE